jgi:hypothetical protein
MTFKTHPHRYTIGPAPTSRARCRGCRRSIEKGALRLALHAFVRPNRGTTFARHLTTECVGTAVAADVLRARSVPHGVRVDCGLEPGTVACAWDELEAQAAGRVNESSGRQHGGQLQGEVGGPRQPVVGTMLCYLGGVEVGRCEQKEDA